MDDDCPKCDVQSCNLTECKTYIPDKNDYFNIDIFGDNDEKLLKIKNTIFGRDINYDTVINEIPTKIATFLEKTTDAEWVKCNVEGGGKPIKRNNAVKKTNACALIRQYGELELNSTAYMLRVLTQSVIGKGTIKFEFAKNTSVDKITGRWNNDSGLINIITITTSGENDTESNNGMLIMGLGPSASGKSFMAKKIIKIMKETIGNTFPDFFFNIDGGKYRELSVVYQSVIEGIKQYSNEGKQTEINKCVNNNVAGNQTEIEIGGGGTTCSPCNLSSKPSDYLALAKYKGINDLKKYINTSNIKNEVIGYLNGQRILHTTFRERYSKLQINLYVPDTLVSCGTGIDRCMGKIKKYIDLTNSHNKWISTLIYQHKIGEDKCPYYKLDDSSMYGSPPPPLPPDEDKKDEEEEGTFVGGSSKIISNLNKNLMCNGTIKSGVEREKCESKIYDDSNWEDGYRLGLKYTERATYSDTYRPGLVLRIHNSGDKDRQSIIESVKFSGTYYDNFKNAVNNAITNADNDNVFTKNEFYIGPTNIVKEGGTRKRVRHKNVKGQKKTTRKKKCGQQKRTRKTKNIKKTKKNRKTRKYRK